MSTEVNTYEDVMQQADDALKHGKLPLAIQLFERAATLAHTNAEEARAHQMKSIVLSMSGHAHHARLASEAALKLVSKDATASGRILRDAGMIFVRKAKYEKNESKQDALLAAGLKLLEQSMKRLEEEPGNELEESATLGFIGRHDYVAGNQKIGYEYMADADARLQLGHNRTYELDNLMWLIRAAPISERYGYAKRILKLIELTGDVKRKDELLLIMVGGDWLYRFVDERPWIIKLVNRVRGN